jgi:hypothetical protein
VQVQWCRRLTPAELDTAIAAEQQRRQDIIDADPDQPAPGFGPLPGAADFTRTVYTCGGHAINRDAAAHVHASTCTAPNNSALPGCDCTPEPLPTPPAPAQTVTLATGWTLPAAA